MLVNKILVSQEFKAIATAALEGEEVDILTNMNTRQFHDQNIDVITKLVNSICLPKINELEKDFAYEVEHYDPKVNKDEILANLNSPPDWTKFFNSSYHIPELLLNPTQSGSIDHHVLANTLQSANTELNYWQNHCYGDAAVYYAGIMADRANLIEWSNSCAAQMIQQQQKIQQIVRDSHQRFAESLKKTQQATVDLMKYSQENQFYLGKYDLSNISAGLFKTDNRPAYTWSTNHTTPNDSWYKQIINDELDDLFSEVFYEEPELIFGISPMSASHNMKDYIL